MKPALGSISRAVSMAAVSAAAVVVVLPAVGRGEGGSLQRGGHGGTHAVQQTAPSRGGLWSQGVDFCAGGDDAADCAALVDLAVQTNSAWWSFNRGWLTNRTICDWELVGCDAAGRVKILALSFNNLTGGPIRPSFGGLSRLVDWDFEGNQVSGPIAPGIVAGLTSLREIGIGGNLFSGLAPRSFCTTALNATLGPACHMAGNRFECPLPRCLEGRCGASCQQSLAGRRGTSGGAVATWT